MDGLHVSLDSGLCLFVRPMRVGRDARGCGRVWSGLLRRRCQRLVLRRQGRSQPVSRMSFDQATPVLVEQRSGGLPDDGRERQGTSQHVCTSHGKQHKRHSPPAASR